MTEHSYEGAAFVPGGQRLSGTIRVTAAGVTLESPDGTATIPIEGATMRAGGAADRLIFFEHPAVPETSIYTSDKRILNDPALAPLQAHTKRIRGESHRKTAVLITILLVIAGVFVGLYALRGPLVSLAARQVPPNIERKLGDVAMRQILLTAKIESNEAVTVPMQKILDEVKRGAGETPYEFRLVVIEDETVNAFALPGGQLAIHTGLIEKAKNADEIAGVLGHEIAHVTERHSLRQLISTIGIWAIVQAVLGDVSGIIVAAAEGGANLLVLRFSREAEAEADARGVEFLRKAGIDPRGMASFFETLKAEEGAAGKIPAFLSTHPASEERAERLRKLIAESETKGMRSLAIDIKPAQKALQ